MSWIPLFIGFALGVSASGIFGGLLGLAWLVRKDREVETLRNGARLDAGVHGGVVPRPAEPAGGLRRNWFDNFGRDE